MRIWLRNGWPVGLGLLAAALVLVVRGLGQSSWTAATTVMVVALLAQLVVSGRASFQRERRLVRTAAQLREVSAELDRLARTDPLTGVANRRACFDLLGVEFRRSRRYGRDLSVLMLDLDHFKDINDRWGHPFGDHVLRDVAVAIRQNVRESDLLGRYGGEEFVLALPESDAAQALRVAEKLREALAALEFREGGTPPAGEAPVRLTASIGIASLPVGPDHDEFELIRRADHALYEAKRAGRDRVAVYAEPAPLGTEAG